MADIQKLNVNNTTYDISTTWSKVTGKPSTFPPESHTHNVLDGLSTIKTFNISLRPGTSWMDTGIEGTSLDSGTYIVQVLVDGSGQGGLWGELFSGIMSWYNRSCNDANSDEIFLHKAGHASNGQSVYLRTLRQRDSNVLKLQIAASQAFTNNVTIQFKFKKMI